MDMTNRQIRITRTSSISIPMETIVDVDVLEEKATGMRTVVASFEMSFDQIYGGPTDPNLLLAIQERLQAA
jgi:hypothetical protein